MTEQRKKIEDLKPDPMNARRHTPRGIGSIERSINRDGFGRSILLSEDYVIAAGNATTEAAMHAGLDKVRVIDTDGTEVIAIRRTDITSGTSEFVNLAIADNRAAEHSDFDADILSELETADLLNPDEFWFPDEYDRIGEEPSVGDQPDSNPDDRDDADTTEPSEYYAIIVEAKNEKEQSRLLDRFAAEGLSCRALMS